MNELIPITRANINDQEVNAVDARKLHEFLESKQEFVHWISNRIEKYGFKEHQDYEVFDKFIKNPSVGPVSQPFLIPAFFSFESEKR